MAKENKTQKTTASVADFLASVTPEARRKDCATVSKLMKKAAGKPGKMWGTSIVGFGDVRIKGASREVDWFLVGFSPRKAALTLYLGFSLTQLEPQLKKLGKHKRGGGCLYLNSLDDVDLKVLEKMINQTVKNVKAAGMK
ncbi:MAG: DUF1801 domain-containing protein [Archangium sp.]|nr:DUF1801 domain-containing protein [Archangium sp.]